MSATEKVGMKGKEVEGGKLRILWWQEMYIGEEMNVEHYDWN